MAFTVHAPPSEYMLSDIVGNAGEVEPEPLSEAIVAALRQVNDPEIPVNIYDLGLIYRIDIAADGDVDIRHDADARLLPGGRHDAAFGQERGGRRGRGRPDQGEDGLGPPWNQERLSDEVKLALGIL